MRAPSKNAASRPRRPTVTPGRAGRAIVTPERAVTSFNLARHKVPRFSTVLLFVACVLISANPAGAAPPRWLQEKERWLGELFNEVAPSVVLISGGDRFGSGFFVAPGLVLTNAHVVGKKKRVDVVLHDARRMNGLVVEHASEEVDLALVRVNARDVAPLPLGQSSHLRMGQWVGAVGHGEGTLWSFNDGMVSNIYPAKKSRPVFQTQIPINPGNSGGPVVDSNGQVVGVVTASITSANNINFAIKIDLALKRLGKLRAALARAKARGLTVLAPPDTVILLDGVMVGRGPSLTLKPPAGKHEVAAVIGGDLRRVSVEVPRQHQVDLRRP